MRDGTTPPGRLWHGTRSEFSAFDPRMLGSRVDNPTTGLGFWMSDTPEGAAVWAVRDDDSRRAGRLPAPSRPVILEVRARPATYLRLTGSAFSRWLVWDATLIRKARACAILDGFAGVAVIWEDGRDGDAAWFCAFDPADVTIVGRRPAA